MTTRENPLAELKLIGGRLCPDYVNTVDTHDTRIDDGAEPSRAGAVFADAVELREAPGEDGFGWVWEAGEGLERVLWPVVRDAAELLDTSRNRSRRWCDMQSCGNRARARRHYHRVRGAEA